MKTKTPRNILLFLLAFLGLGAIGGGGALILSPSGELIGMPVTMLEKSPFTSFLVPGIILFLILGIAPCLLIIGLLKKPESQLAEKINFFKDMHWSWTFCIYMAFALIIWIQAEIVFLDDIHWLQTFYMSFAVIIIFVALLPQVRNLYKK